MNAQTVLKQHHLRITPARVRILETILQLKSPVTMEHLDDLVSKQGPKITLSTLYRFVDVLFNYNIIDKIYIPDDASFRIMKKHALHNHYLRCLKCHKLIVLDHCPLQPMDDYVNETYHFKAIAQYVEITGYCRDCQ